MSKRKRPEELRSHRWLGVSDLRAFGHRARLRQGGFDDADFSGKPVIAIINTWSDINFCHTHLRDRAEDVKRGVMQAGGFPVELPAMSLGRALRETIDNALSQSSGDGDRGASAQPSDRWCRANGRMRQDHARPGYGCDQHGLAGNLRAGRTAVAGQLAGPAAWLRLGRLEILG